MHHKTKHTVITGTGRAGTTVLIDIMTRLGLDTGFGIRDLANIKEGICRAGLEKFIWVSGTHSNLADLPEVLKTPDFCDMLGPLLKNKLMEIKWVIIPLRDLDAAAASRTKVHHDVIARDLDPKDTPGGLWGTDDPAAQKHVLAVKLAQAIDAVTRHRVPTDFISFPDFINDSDYFVDCLGPGFLQHHGITSDELFRAHKEAVDPALLSAL